KLPSWPNWRSSAMVRSSAFWPACQPPNPHEEVRVRSSSPAASKASCAITSAVGERQIFPVQTKQMCTWLKAWEGEELKASDIWTVFTSIATAEAIGSDI